MARSSFVHLKCFVVFASVPCEVILRPTLLVRDHGIFDGFFVSSTVYNPEIERLHSNPWPQKELLGSLPRLLQKGLGH